MFCGYMYDSVGDRERGGGVRGVHDAFRIVLRARLIVITACTSLC